MWKTEIAELKPEAPLWQVATWQGSIEHVEVYRLLTQSEKSRIVCVNECRADSSGWPCHYMYSQSLVARY